MTDIQISPLYYINYSIMSKTFGLVVKQSHNQERGLPIINQLNQLSIQNYVVKPSYLLLHIAILGFSNISLPNFCRDLSARKELSLQQDACRDNSEDPSDVETEAFPRVGRPTQGTACCCLGVFVVLLGRGRGHWIMPRIIHIPFKPPKPLIKRGIHWIWCLIF